MKKSITRYLAELIAVIIGSFILLGIGYLLTGYPPRGYECMLTALVVTLLIND